VTTIPPSAVARGASSKPCVRSVTLGSGRGVDSVESERSIGTPTIIPIDMAGTFAYFW